MLTNAKLNRLRARAPAHRVRSNASAPGACAIGGRRARAATDDPQHDQPYALKIIRTVGAHYVETLYVVS